MCPLLTRAMSFLSLGAMCLSVAFCSRLSMASQRDESSPLASLAGEIELSRLVDLSAARLGLSLQYPKGGLAKTVTIRQTEGLTDEAVWRLANQLLIAENLCVIQPPESNILQVVPLVDAKNLARIETPGTARELAPLVGFMRVRVPLRHQSVKYTSEAVTPLLVKPAGSVEALGESNQILVAGPTTTILDVLDLIDLLDVSDRSASVRVMTPNRVPAEQLALQVVSVVESLNSLASKPIPGRLIAAGGGDALVLVAPPNEIEFWSTLIEQFDKRGEVTSRIYQPEQFTLGEVRSLIEQTSKEPMPRGSGNQWEIVEDSLTGSLIITATPSEHARVNDLMRRLREAPSDGRRPMRAFPIRNRSVNEIMSVLERLVEQGALGSVTNLEVTEPAPTLGTNGTYSTGMPDDHDSVRSAPPPTLQLSPGESLPRIAERPDGIQQQQPPSQSTATEEITRTRHRGDELQRTLELTADEGTNTLIAIGDPRVLEQLAELIKQLDVRQPQVKIEVLVVGLTDAQTIDLGVELEKLEVSGNTLISLSSLFGLSTGTTAAGNVSARGQGFSGVVINPGDFSVVIRALETINDGRSVNLPHLLVNNNQSGTLNSVLQEPFTSTNASDTVATTSFAGTQDAGTTVTVRPQIAEGDHLVLEYSVAISNFVGESSSPGIPPPRQQNSLQSIVTIPDGYTIAVGGIEIISDAKATSQVPLLGDVPGLGELFKNRSNSHSRTRFYVFIRATVLRHGGFEDLKYISEADLARAGVDDGWPVVEPRLIR